MPNTILKPTAIAATALGLLQRELVLPGLVWTDAVADWAGKYNDTVTIRIPARTTARRRTLRDGTSGRNIVTDTLTETGIDVKITEDIYNAVPITDEELTLDISDFGAQILAPQVRAVAEGAENDLAACMAGATYNTTVELFGGLFDGIVDARKALNDANVPLGQRAIVVGSAIEAALLKDDQFNKVDQSGSDSALREAQIGRVAGMDVYSSNALDPAAGYAFHKSAYIMATRAPIVPQGAAFGQSTSYQGLAMRWLKDYDFTSTTDRSLVDTYAGYKAVNDGPSSKVVRAVKLTYTES